MQDNACFLQGKVALIMHFKESLFCSHEITACVEIQGLKKRMLRASELLKHGQFLKDCSAHYIDKS